MWNNFFDAKYVLTGLYCPFNPFENSTIWSNRTNEFPSYREVLNLGLEEEPPIFPQASPPMPPEIQIPYDQRIIFHKPYEEVAQNNNEGILENEKEDISCRVRKKAICFICCKEKEDSEMKHGPCFHYYCDICWRIWLEENASCPYCRKPIKWSNLRPLWSLPARCGNAFKQFVNMRRKELQNLVEFIDPIKMEAMINKEWKVKSPKERSAFSRKPKI